MVIDVITTCGTTPGWAPVVHMARLAADMFQGRFVHLPHTGSSRWRKLVALRSRRRGPPGRGLLVILRTAYEINLIRQTANFRSNYDRVMVWVIDAFHSERMPPRRSFADIDVLAVMRPNDMARFRTVAGDRVIWLGWGSDVLGRGSEAALRSTDVLRVGRQPVVWDDDAVSTAQLAQRGLVFRGRPPMSVDPAENQRLLQAACADTRMVLAHSNLASPAGYTHATEEYMTARWTDALACGATVAGKHPRSDHSMAELLWPGATIDFDRIDLAHNIDALCDAARDWTPEQARHNHRQALARLDWRWRLKQLVDRAGLTAPRLEADLARIQARLGALSS